MGFGTQQRPGLDGSSSDSDDGTTNFARSRIGTVQQPQLAALLDEREQEAEANHLGKFFNLKRLNFFAYLYVRRRTKPQKYMGVVFEQFESVWAYENHVQLHTSG